MQNELQKKLNFEKKIELYNEISIILLKHNLTVWQVIAYLIKNGGHGTSSIKSFYSNWNKFGKTHQGLSLKRLLLIKEWTEKCILNPPKQQWNTLRNEIRYSIKQYNISTKDLYNYWIEYHNSIRTNKFSICTLKQFRDCLACSKYLSTGAFGYKRLEEIKTVLKLMLNQNYHRTN